MNGNPETPQNSMTIEPTPLEKKEPGKRKDFWIGFGGSILGNILLFGVIYGLGNVNYIPLGNNAQLIKIFSTILLALPWAINVVAIILLLIFRRPRIVLGILASYAIGILAGLCWVAYCFMTGAELYFR